MFGKLFRTDTRNLVLTILRLVLGVVFFAHGAQKALGWFGGYGFNGTMAFFTQQMGIPSFFAFLAICAEFLGGIGLILGLFGRVAAFGIACNMVVAIVMVHHQFGLFMNWGDAKRGRIRVPPAGPGDSFRNYGERLWRDIRGRVALHR